LRVVSVDFDGTLCDFDFPRIGTIKPGAKEAMIRLKELGYYIVIFSCRASRYCPDLFSCMGKYAPEFLAMKDWLDANEIPYDEIDDGTKGKPFAEFYIDDKGVRYDNNWDEVIKFVEGKNEPTELESLRKENEQLRSELYRREEAYVRLAEALAKERSD
jgi:hypothetical protein